ncbi:MAG: DEAD/DEAH box helicase, partial [Blastocatellia bacterium]|nr:DEAD/DEAH box helicase [Blastocatellia bacterium]
MQTPIIELPGHIAKLSPTMARRLAAAVAQIASKTNVENATVEDLLNYFPTRYEDRSHFIEIDQLADGMDAAVEIFVRNSGATQVGRNRDPRKPPLFIFEITGGDAEHRFKPVVVKWFISGRNAKSILEYYEKQFVRGTRFVAYGMWEFDDRKGTYALKLAKPDELEILPSSTTDLFSEDDEQKGLNEDTASPEFAMVHTARRVPVYRKLADFQTKRLREIVHSVLTGLDATSVDELLPPELITRQNLATRARALREIHFPPDDASIADYEMFRSDAQRRLIFEEFFWLSFSMQLLRGERQKEPKGTVIEIGELTRQRLKNFLPFELTCAQKRVIGEIFDDLKSDAPMNRLIQGDVGSGKTIVAFLAAFAAMENGYQVALMAPTEILAEQHARNAKGLFAESGYRVELLIGSTKAAEKRKIYQSLADGEIDLIIGTHAL